MKISLLLLLLTSICLLLNAQKNNTSNWIFELDTSKYNVSKNTNRFSNFFLESIGREKDEIALHDSNFSRGCVGPVHTRLNWISNTINGIQFVSISFSGNASWTSYYISKEPKLYSITPRLPIDSILSIGQIIKGLRTKEFEIENEVD